MKRASVFIVLACGILISTTAFANNHTNKNLDLSPDVDPKLSSALRAYEHRNFKKALKLLSPIAKRGESEAQFILGRIYTLGLGTKRDTTKAKRWYRKAAKQGHPPAQYYLASILKRKEDGKRNRKAVALLHKAAKGGYAPAQSSLAEEYIYGDVLKPSFSMWYYWVRKSAYQGYSYARFQLSTAYYWGSRAPKDPVLALMWGILAAKSGSPTRKSWVDLVSKRMTPKQIKEAKRLAGFW